MAVFRTDSILHLALLVSCVGGAEALSLGDPITCYILDAVLLVYCIIFTALYFRIKISRLHPAVPSPSDPVYEGLNIDQMNDPYQTFENSQTGDPSRRNRDQQVDCQYEALRAPGNDEYQEIKKKGKLRKSRSKGNEPLSRNRSDAAIEMEPIPPLPERS